MIPIEIYLMMENWEVFATAEHKWDTNNLKIIRTFIFESKTITSKEYSVYLERYNNNLIKNKPVYLDHISYLWKITDDIYTMCNITSHSHIRTPDGNINNIYLKENIFKFITPTVFIDSMFLDAFIQEVEWKTGNLPINIRPYNIEEIAQNAEKAMYESLKYSYENQHSFYRTIIKYKSYEIKTFINAIEEIKNSTECKNDLRNIENYKEEIANFLETRKLETMRYNKITKIQS